MIFCKKEPIEKGWSNDKKYCVTDEAGKQYLLRVSDFSEFEKKQAEFSLMQQLAAMGIPMCIPVAFGTSQEGVYSLQSWIDGADAEIVLPNYPDDQQYSFGITAGQILQTIHSIPAPGDRESWEIRFNRKMDRKIKLYRECPIQYESGQAFIDYIQNNRNLLENRPQTFQHGDYHIGNMMIDRKDQLYIIDFNRYDFGDPWEEFNRIVWCAQTSPIFASGMVDGYFHGDVPTSFWKLLALYISSNTLCSVYWALPFGERQVKIMLDQAKQVLKWYDHMENPVPTWYCQSLKCR